MRWATPVSGYVGAMSIYDETNPRGSFPRLAIVTGADSGIGRATALLLATEGFDIGLTVHRDTEGAAETAREVTNRGQRCVQAPFDASAPNAGAVIERLAGELGGLGVLVNVAGAGQSDWSEKGSPIAGRLGWRSAHDRYIHILPADSQESANNAGIAWKPISDERSPRLCDWVCE